MTEENMVNASDCNSIASKHFGRETEEMGGSHVSVNGGSADPGVGRDLDSTEGRKSTEMGNGESELNAGSSSVEQTRAESDEWIEEKGGRGKGCAENGSPVEESAVAGGCVTDHEELREEKRENGESSANGGSVEGGDVSLTLDASREDDVRVAADIFEGQKNGAAIVNGEENVESQIAVVEGAESESKNVVVESEELKEGNGEGVESFGENGCVVEESVIPNGAESKELREKEESVDDCVANGYFVATNGVSSGVDGSHDEPDKDVVANDIVESRKEFGLVVEIGENQESESELNASSLCEQTVDETELKEANGETGKSSVDDNIIVEDSVIPKSDELEQLKEESVVEDSVIPRSDELEPLKEENGESCAENHSIVEDSGVSSSVDGLHGESNKDDVEANDNIEGQKKLQLVEEVEETESPQNAVVEGIKSQDSVLHRHENGNETEIPSNADELLETPDLVSDEKLATEVELAESCSEVTNGSVVTGDLKDVVRSITIKESTGLGIKKEPKPETTISVSDEKIETEVDDPVELAESHSEVTNGSAVTGELMDEVRSIPRESGMVETENGSGESDMVEIENGSAKGVQNMLTCSVEGPDSDVEITNVSVEDVKAMSPSSVAVFSINDIGPASEVRSVSTVEGSDLSISSSVKGKVENGSAISGVDLLDACPVDDESKIVDKNDEHVESCTGDSKSETNATNGDIQSSEVLVTRPADDLKLEAKVTNGHSECGEGIISDGVIKPSEEDESSADLDIKVDAESIKRLPNFIIRVPRYADDEFRVQIKTAQVEVDEKTQHRDSIRVAMQHQKATCNEHWEKFEAARREERTARDAVSAKRQEMDSIQLVMNRMRNATSIEEIDQRMHNMEHMIEHETMPLTEEKKFIREIKQLKHVREQLCANSGTQAEIQEAFDQKDVIEERFKLLKKELDSLRSEVQQTEGFTKAAKKKHYDECEKLKELQAQFRAADNLRQEAYAHMQKLKKQSYDKNKYFRMYKEDERIALDYASKGDREALQRFCASQVEKIMELWNNNDDFRKDYVKHNIMSTLRRLKTLDGRSLGPDEEPPLLRNLIEERTDAARFALTKRSTSLVAPASEMKHEKVIVSVPVEESVVKLKVEQKNLPAKAKKTTKLISEETASVTVSSRVEVVEETEEGSKRTKEEEEKAKKAEELARKEEELRKEEAAAKLKEQLRLEEKAKAEAAEERKRRNAEKAQARAELKAKKEAELKEKEREKKLRKKQRKKAATAGMTSGSIEGVPAEVSENSQPEATQEPEIRDKPTKKTPKSVPPTKPSKTKSLPPPLRNRARRKMQPWMWALLIAVLLLALFLVGNNISSFKFSLPSIGF